MSSIFDGKEFIFNAVTDFHQRNVQITSLKGGGFVATWQSTNGDGDTNGYTGVVARIWNPKTGFGDEFVVNQTIAGSQADPEVIQLKDNRLLFGWESAAPGDVYGYTAYARVFSKTGTALHDEVQISSLDGQGGFNIEFDQLSNGMIVGSWYNRHYTGSAYSGTHQIAYFDPDNIAGATTTGFSADNASGARDIGADVLALADGTYVVNAINNNSPYYEDVFYHFDASGGTISGPDRASQLLAQTYEDSDPDAAQLSGGRVVMVWDTGISLGEIRMQIFKSDLTPIGTTQQVGKVGVNAVDPAIAATPDGGFVVVYNANSTITMVRYDRLGEKVGGPYAVSQHLEKGNGFPEVETLSDGSIAVTWTRFTNDNYTDVFGRLLKPALYGSNSKDTLTDQVGANWIDGRNGADILKGLGGNDTIFGDRGDDKIYGGGGKDRLAGEKGNDLLVGGKSRDVFVFAKKDGHDVVQDFTPRSDKIDLSAFHFKNKSAALAEFNDAGGQHNHLAKFSHAQTVVTFKGVDLHDITSHDLII